MSDSPFPPSPPAEPTPPAPRTSREGQGFLQGPDGELSSGRLIKIGSFVVAVITSIVGFALLAIPATANPNIGTYAFQITGLFAGLAVGAEASQRIGRS